MTIGAELRVRREERNQTLRDVADVVRIQMRYLEALEDDRIENLPGRVYALGFVRTYAEYLGLDANDMVARFKQEAKGLEPQSDLTLPEPIDEGKVPTAAIVIVAILLAGAAYSAWYFMSGPDSRIVDIVPEVPERLAGLVDGDPPGEEPSIPALVENLSDSLPSAPTQEPRAVGDAGTAAGKPPEAAQAAVPAPVPTATPEPAPPPVPAAAEPPAPPASRIAAAPAPVIETPPAPVPAPVPPPPAFLPEGVETALAPAPPPSAAPPAIARDPVVYGAANRDARIVITALEDAWVEVTDAGGAILFSRVLRKGDTYRAPDRPDATFVTGNAGGLVIEVDGVPAPSLGPAGVVRKNVRLDPDLLKAGQALP